MNSLSMTIQMKAAEFHFPVVLWVFLTLIAGRSLVLSVWKEVSVTVFTLPSFTKGVSIWHFSFDLFLKQKVSLIKSLS